jgi:hypothetical protein
VHQCSDPPVTVADIRSSDTTVCIGGSLSITGEYTDKLDCLLGDDLIYKWEFRQKDSVNWKTLIDNQTSASCGNGIKTTKPLNITSAGKADEGWYRVVVRSSVNRNDNTNCRTSSDSIYVRIGASVAAPDIRVQVCPVPNGGDVRLSSFLDSTLYTHIAWEALSCSPSVDAATGLIAGGFAAHGTYTYRYSAGLDTAACATAKVYVRTLHDRILTKTDTVLICHTDSAVQLNQIFGLELGGVWDYGTTINPDQTVANNIRTFSPVSKYAGAQIFNAHNAYITADPLSYPAYTYRGVSGKKFEFLYTGGCMEDKKIVLIVY